VEISQKNTRINEMMDKLRISQELHCPYCDYMIIGTESLAYVVTYWGYPDEPVKEIECMKCEKKFYVKELVLRTYESFKTSKEVEGGSGEK